MSHPQASDMIRVSNQYVYVYIHISMKATRSSNNLYTISESTRGKNLIL